MNFVNCPHVSRYSYCKVNYISYHFLATNFEPFITSHNQVVRNSILIPSLGINDRHSLYFTFISIHPIHWRYINANGTWNRVETNISKDVWCILHNYHLLARSTTNTLSSCHASPDISYPISAWNQRDHSEISIAWVVIETKDPIIDKSDGSGDIIRHWYLP